MNLYSEKKKNLSWKEKSKGKAKYAVHDIWSKSVMIFLSFILLSLL